MKFILSITIFLLGFVAGGCCHLQNEQVFNIPTNRHDSVVSNQYSKDYYRSVVKIQVRKRDKSGAIVASGFAINKTQIMTAGHFCVGVVTGKVKKTLKKKIEIIFLNNNDELSLLNKNVYIETINVQADLCVLKVDRHGIIPLEFASYKDIKIHQPVSVIGAPVGMFPVETHGYIIELKSQGWHDSNLNNRLIISAPATHGNSGGPILTEGGKVVGIVMAKHANYDHITIGVHSDTIKEYLKEKYGK